jgi:hypothetical protein
MVSLEEGADAGIQGLHKPQGLYVYTITVRTAIDMLGRLGKKGTTLHLRTDLIYL